MSSACGNAAMTSPNRRRLSPLLASPPLVSSVTKVARLLLTTHGAAGQDCVWGCGTPQNLYKTPQSGYTVRLRLAPLDGRVWHANSPGRHRPGRHQEVGVNCGTSYKVIAAAS